MNIFVPRRTFLTAFAAVSGAALLAACSDSGDKAATAESSSAPATPASSTPAPATPAPAASVAAPKAEGTVDMAKLLEPGVLPEMIEGKADAPVTIVEYASMTCSH